MFSADPPNKQGLAAAYGFGPEDVEKTADGKVRGRKLLGLLRLPDGKVGWQGG